MAAATRNRPVRRILLPDLNAAAWNMAHSSGYRFFCASCHKEIDGNAVPDEWDPRDAGGQNWRCVECKIKLASFFSVPAQRPYNDVEDLEESNARDERHSRLVANSFNVNR
jgi:hypothetical protein